jgi:hypothetical protein
LKAKIKTAGVFFKKDSPKDVIRQLPTLPRALPGNVFYGLGVVAAIFGMVVIGAPVKALIPLPALLHNHITVRTFGAFEDIAGRHPVVCHKIADLRFVAADIQINSIVLVMLVLEGQPADRALQRKPFGKLQVQFFVMRQVKFLDQFDHKA